MEKSRAGNDGAKCLQMRTYDSTAQSRAISGEVTCECCKFICESPPGGGAEWLRRLCDDEKKATFRFCLSVCGAWGRHYVNCQRRRVTSA